jgi:hypothetical protein
MPVVIVGSKCDVGRRMEMTRAANQALIDGERRRGVLIAIPIAIVAIAAATYAFLVQGGYLR